MKILVKKQKNGGGKTKQIGEVDINKTGISFSSETIDVYGLKTCNYFGIGKRENGSIVAIFTKEESLGFNKLTSSGSKSKTFRQVLIGENKRNMSRYIGKYTMLEEVPLLDKCRCYILRPTAKN